jgi:hypothetical protein
MEWKNHVGKAIEQLTKYGGLKALGNIFASRKGVFGILAIIGAYVGLLGVLPADADPDIVKHMSEIFGNVVAIVSALFIGGTALEDYGQKRQLPPAEESDSSSASESK